jgi:hypothetical protein
MPLDPAYLLGLLTRDPGVSTHQYSGAGWRAAAQNMQHDADRRAAAKQNKNADQYNRLKMAFEREKFAAEQAQKKQGRFAEAMEKAGPELASGAPNRAEAAMAALTAAGGTVVKDTAERPAQYAGVVEDVPEMNLQQEASPYGLGEERRFSPLLDSAGLSYDIDPEFEPAPEEEAPGEFDLARPEEIEPGVHEVSPYSEHEEQFVYDPQGNEVMQYHREGIYNDNVIAVTSALHDLAAHYMPEDPIDSSMLHSIAERATDTALLSEGGTSQDAIEYATDLFEEMYKLRITEAGKDRRKKAGVKAAHAIARKIGKGAVNNDVSFVKGYDRAAKTLNESGEIQRRQTVDMLVQAHWRLGKMIENENIDMSYIAKVVYALARANDPGNPRMTDADVKIAFPPGTDFEQIKNELLSGFGNTLAEWENGLGAMLGADTTISVQTANRLRRAVKVRRDEQIELRNKGLEQLKQVHDGMLASGVYGVANGFAARVRKTYPKSDLRIYTPEEFATSTAAIRPTSVSASGSVSYEGVHDPGLQSLLEDD